MTTVAVVVVRWKGGDEVDRCLASVLEHGGERVADVVLVDSGSADGGAERLAAAFPRVRVLALADNRSFAWAANHGAASCTAPYLLLLNPDGEVRPGTVEALAAYLDDHQATAAAVPLLANPDGSPQHRWQLRRLPTFWRLATGRPAAPAFADPPRSATPVEQPAAAAWLVRRTVWNALGGLDPVFAPAWWEDADLCARLAQRLGEPGFPVQRGFTVVPEASVLHHGGASLAHLTDVDFLAAFHGNLLRFARRHHPRQAALIAAGVRLSLLARATLRPHRRRAYLDALKRL